MSLSHVISGRSIDRHCTMMVAVSCVALTAGAGPTSGAPPAGGRFPAAKAIAQSVLAQNSTPAHDAADRELLGVLRYTIIDFEAEEAPLRDVVDGLREALDINVIPFYWSKRNPSGLDPEMPITLGLKERPALDVVELMLEQATIYEETTWQIRRGILELGTKEDLARPAAAERRHYDITDLTLEPPYLVAPSLEAALAMDFSTPRTTPRTTRDASGQSRASEHPYACAALADMRKVGGPNQSQRKTPEELAAEIVKGIVHCIEPGNWDYGQYEEEVEDPEQRHVMQTGKIAQLRFYRRQLIITAPPFIHREIEDMSPIPPLALSMDERIERSSEGSGAQHTIDVRSQSVTRHEPIHLQPAGGTR